MQEVYLIIRDLCFIWRTFLLKNSDLLFSAQKITPSEGKSLQIIKQINSKLRLLGQKLITALVMLPVISFIAWAWDLPFHADRLSIVFLMGICYVILLFSLHFAVASKAFFFDNVYSLNNSKNMIIWVLTGELMPLGLLPSPIREWVIALPFSCGIYMPAAYLSKRIDTNAFMI
jgi:ABC-type uncharacterized transport system permease subunit